MCLIVWTAVFRTRHRLARFVNVIGQLLLFGSLGFDRSICVGCDRVGPVIVGSPEGLSHLFSKWHRGLGLGLVRSSV